MAAATSTTTAASDPVSDDAADGFLRVYRAVSSGASEHELRRVIDKCARGDEQRRARAVNLGETPLQAAHRLKRGDLVGALVEAGADVGGIFFGPFRSKLAPLAVCIAYGQVESVRALLRAGHEVQAEIAWDPCFDSANAAATPVHVCIAPPSLGLPSDRAYENVFERRIIGAPQIGCLEVLLREGGADVNAPDDARETPIHWLAKYGSSYDDEEEKAARDLLVSAGARTSGVFDGRDHSPLMTAAYYNNVRFARYLIEEADAPVDEYSPRHGYTALVSACFAAESDEMAALLLDAGANVNAPAYGSHGSTPLSMCLGEENAATLRLLLDRGTLVDVINDHGLTPLMMACRNGNWLGDEGWPLFREILRRSSDETRRSLEYEDEFEDEDENPDEFESAVDPGVGLALQAV